MPSKCRSGDSDTNTTTDSMTITIVFLGHTISKTEPAIVVGWRRDVDESDAYLRIVIHNIPHMLKENIGTTFHLHRKCCTGPDNIDIEEWSRNVAANFSVELIVYYFIPYRSIQ